MKNFWHKISLNGFWSNISKIKKNEIKEAKEKKLNFGSLYEVIIFDFVTYYIYIYFVIYYIYIYILL